VELYKIGGMLLMKWLGMVLLLVMTLGSGSGYPIHSGNGAVNCTVFGEFKDPYTIVEPNGDKFIVLYADIALVKVNSTSTPAHAAYSLVDGNDRTYQTRGEFTRSIQPGRQLLGFAVPAETIPKALIIDPTAYKSEGNRFAINFKELANATNGNMTLLYYGVLNSKISSNIKSMDFDVALTNNGTSKRPISLKNFSLIDQWGWRYHSLENDAYSGGLADRELKPNETARFKVSFDSMSPLSRPSKLAYECSKTSSIVLDIDPEAGLLGNATKNQGSSCGACSSGGAEPAPSTLAGSIKATKARLQKVRESL
jgi:hypothetical protein